MNSHRLATKVRLIHQQQQGARKFHNRSPPFSSFSICNDDTPRQISGTRTEISCFSPRLMSYGYGGPWIDSSHSILLSSYRLKTGIISLRSFSSRCQYQHRQFRSIARVEKRVSSDIDNVGDKRKPNSNLSSSHPSNEDDCQESYTKSKPFEQQQQQQQQNQQNENTSSESLLKQLHSPPNLITLTRIFTTPVISYLIISEQYSIALYGCLAFGFTDWLDGYIAKTYNMHTVLGTYLDPFADKFMVNTLSISLGWNGILPIPIVLLWLGRDLGLIGATYYHAKLATKDGDQVIDPAKTPLKVKPSNISKVNTVFQFMTLAAGLTQPLGGVSPDVVLGLCWITAGTTIVSGWLYSDGSSLIASNNKITQKVVQKSQRIRESVQKKSKELREKLKETKKN